MSPATASLTDESTATAAAASASADESPYHVPNAEGVFGAYEKIPLSRFPVGTCGEFRLAHVAGGFVHAGYWLHIRSPKNTAELLPRVGELRFPGTELALLWLCDNVAANFFTGHKAAKKALADWKERLLRSMEEARKLELAEQAAATAAPETATAPEQPAAAAMGGAVEAHFESIPIEDIESNPHNPRREVEADREALHELARSIAAQGFLLQPVAVRDLGEAACPRYRLISGWRRWQAHRLLEHGMVPGLEATQQGKWARIEAKVFRGVDDARAGELALIENLQRAQLNPMEEARGFAELRERYGYDVPRMVERTGKAESTIKNALRIAALPAEVCGLVAAGDLAPSVAKLLAAPRWAQRPEHCVALAKWIVAEKLTRAEAEEALGVPIAVAAGRALEAAGMAAEVTSYRDRVEIPAETAAGRGPEVVEGRSGSLWHLDLAAWKVTKARLDAAARAQQKAEAEKAAQRVKTAATERVNVKVADLARAKLSYVPLTGDLARYIDHLPAATVADGLDTEEAALVVCLAPEELKRLQVREAELLKADTAAKLPKLMERATEAIRRWKRIDGRVLAFVADAVAECCWCDGAAFELLGIEPPVELSRSALAQLDGLELAKVFGVSALLGSSGGDLFDRLRWVLEVAELGLAEETEAGRARVLEAAARELWPERTTDPKTLAEWQKAAGLGMPVAEIARSYKTTEADVRGALEAK